MVTESPGYETGLRVYCIIKKILGWLEILVADLIM
jgi:hypothetical protein